MEIGKNWGKVDPIQAPTFSHLGQREQSAIRISLTGIRQWQITDEAPKPIKIKITKDNPFDLKSFANTLHELGIGISDSLKQEGEIVIFQPKPYSEKFPPRGTEDRLDALRQRLQEEIENMPPGIREKMDKWF